MVFLIKAAQLVLSLSILVVLHELGHFIPARLFKIRVEKFYLFFDPWFSLFKKKIGGTEYGIGWLPLGGYVKIAGMVDESMDKEQLAEPAKPWEFRSKPAWQRLIVMIGGVTVNLILGMVIYIFVFFTWGVDQLHPEDVKHGLEINPIMEQYGLRSGDNIFAINGKKVESITDINPTIFLRGGRTLSVVHEDGERETVELPEGIEYKLFHEGVMQPVGMRNTSTVVDSVIASEAAAKAGLKKGDKIIRVNNEKVTYFDQITRQLYLSKGKKVALEVERNGKPVDLTASVSKEGKLGFVIYTDTTTIPDYNNIQHVQYDFGQSIGKGLGFGYNTLHDYVAQMKFLFTKKGASSVGGFASIGKMFPPVWDWRSFWMITALLSIILAFMNILPIPALDGGHIVFLLYEIITGREAPQKVLEYAQYVGFILILALMLYANGNDIYHALFDK